MHAAWKSTALAQLSCMYCRAPASRRSRSGASNKAFDAGFCLLTACKGPRSGSDAGFRVVARPAIRRLQGRIADVAGASSAFDARVPPWGCGDACRAAAMRWPSAASCPAQVRSQPVARLAACRTWGVESENRPQRGQFLPDSQAHSPAMGQEGGEKWTAAADLQPTLPKSDRLLVSRATQWLDGRYPRRASCSSSGHSDHWQC